MATLVELWERQANASPDAVAVVAGDQSVSFTELDERAAVLARQLRARGVGPESLVGVSIERSVDLVVALLGILKAGGAYVPLDPSYPADRLRYMVADSRVRLVLCDGRQAEESPLRADVELFPVDRLRLVADTGRVAAGVAPNNLAYVIYTSGSTGRPKGVAVTHASIASFLTSMAVEPGLAAGDRVLGLTPLSFDISTLEIFLPLTVGATVVLAPAGANTDPELLADTIEQQAVTVVQATPTTWRMLVESDWPGDQRLVLLSGGEPLDPVLAKELSGRGRELWNMYGPTETTVWSTVARVDEVEDRIGVGAPIRATRVYVVDEHGRQVEPGATGELWIGGIGLARGYVDRPGLTADRFVPDPFGAAGGRLYRTGDLARFRPDGGLEVIGRADQQVKVRGHRIELGEIESALRSHPRVADCLVGVDRSAGGDLLVAYVVRKELALEESVPADWPARLRSHVAGQLPGYMVPQGYAALDELPRTPAGKADRNALAGLPYERVRAENRGGAPVSAAAELILGVWRDVLGVPDMSAHDDFFAMGGQSLTAVRSIARLREVLGVPVELPTVFEAPTAVALARELRATAVSERSDPIPRLRPSDEPALSFGQERIWVFEQLDTGVPAYHVPVAVSFPDGPVDLAALELSLVEILRRHEVLRTAFVTEGGRTRPVVGPVPGIGIPVAEVAESDVDDVVTAHVREPFDLEEGTLLRGILLRTPTREIFLMTVHHIACDGWSIDVLLRELGTLYRDLAAGRPSSLPEVGLQYADFAAWQRAELSGAGLDRRLDYWRDRLAGVPALELPLDKPRPVIASHAGARELFRVPAALVEPLRALCCERGVTLFMGLLAPLQVLLGRYAGQTDVPVGTLVGGRSRQETEDLVGYLVNTVVLRTDTAGDPTWLELLDRVKDVALGAYANQDVPFERLVDELRPERDLSRNPLFQVLFAMHDAARPEGLTEAVSRRDLEGRLGSARFDLAFDVTDFGDDLEVSIEYATDLFDPSTVARLGRHLTRVLAQLVAAPGNRLSTLEILAPDEVAELVGTPVAPTGAATLVSLWQDQVAATPDAVALVADAERLTYTEVDGRAAALAEVLRGKGVGPESLVGVCLHRSTNLIVALLGVLRAGGAYVPLDPDYPADRLRYLVSDSGVRLVVTDETSAELVEGVEPVLVDRCPTAPGGTVESAVTPVTPVTPANLAYVIYTSGSTGKPKGVAITHANIASFLAWNQRVCELGGRDRALLNHSVAFDNSVWEIFQCLTSGAELHLADAKTAYDPELFLGELADRGITTLNATPSQMRILLDQAEDPAAGLASVRLVFTGAEAVPHDVARRIMAATRPDCQVFNEYGPTEATVTSATCLITEDLLSRHGHRPSVPFGHATDNARLYVLDEHLRPVPPGCRGILHVGGPAVGRGYLNKPGRTASVYLPDPFADEPGGRMYDTGDVVALLPDGNLVFLGRDDHQVKVRGFRIELGEIETALRTHPLVSDCVVAVRRDSLAAYLVPAGELPDNVAAELREHLASDLPNYMLPQLYTTIDEIPLTPNGKVDRDALPDPRPAGTRAVGRRPESELEKLVSRAWQECLELDREVGLDDNFFDVGGNSLAVTGVTAWLSAQLDRRVSPVLIFQHPTVAELAESLAA